MKNVSLDDLTTVTLKHYEKDLVERRAYALRAADSYDGPCGQVHAAIDEMLWCELALLEVRRILKSDERVP